MPKEIIRACVDRVIRAGNQRDAADRALEEHSANAPDPTLLGDAIERLGQFIPASAVHSEALVMFTAKKWRPGREIKVYFMDGQQWAREKVMEIASRWCNQANLKFVVTQDRNAADIRLTFEPGGSWSYLGTDNLQIPVDEPTMQLGWVLDDPSDEAEWVRVVLHEFGHMIDFGHEQAHPQGSISWNKPRVYAYYQGPPNNWSAADVDAQVFRVYGGAPVTNYSRYDKQSIMHYPIPKEFVLDPDDAVGFNDTRSALDRQYASIWYPR